MADLPNKFGPQRLALAHRIMEWCNALTVASATFGITAWFTVHPVLFYISGSIALFLALIFLWGPVFIGITVPHQGRIVNGVLFVVIGILITHKFIAGILLGGCFFALFGMLPLAWELLKQQRADRKGQEEDTTEVAISEDIGRDERVSRMSEAYKRLREMADKVGESTEELEAIASDVDLLKDYVASGEWMKDFEADENGDISPEVNRSVLSEDGLYNLMGDLDEIMHCFERLLEHFAPDSELDKMIQEIE